MSDGFKLEHWIKMIQCCDMDLPAKCLREDIASLSITRMQREWVVGYCKQSVLRLKKSARDLPDHLLEANAAMCVLFICVVDFKDDLPLNIEEYCMDILCELVNVYVEMYPEHHVAPKLMSATLTAMIEYQGYTTSEISERTKEYPLIQEAIHSLEQTMNRFLGRKKAE